MSLQDKARQLGITSQTSPATLNSIVGGATITQVRDGIYLIDVVGRAREAERGSIETLQNLQLPAANGRIGAARRGRDLPLRARAAGGLAARPHADDHRAGRPRPRRAAAGDGRQRSLQPSVDDLRRKLPPGYSIEVGGTVEESGKSQGPIAAVVPLMLFVMATILMIQLQSFQRLFLVVGVAPLGLIGVVAALVPSGAPMGFVAILGVLALIGIMIRNSVILIVQIDEHLRRRGQHPGTPWSKRPSIACGRSC